MARTRERPRIGCGPAPQLVPDGLAPSDDGDVRSVTEMEGCAEAVLTQLDMDVAVHWVDSGQGGLDFALIDEEL